MCTLLFFIVVNSYAQKQKIWVDADTGNETDDIYALARLLAEPSVDVKGVSSAHFNNADLVAFEKWNQYATRNINTVQISQQLNEVLLKVMAGCPLLIRLVPTGKWDVPGVERRPGHLMLRKLLLLK